MAPLTQWTWVWASSRRWWDSGKPGVLQSTGSRRFRHDWVTNTNHLFVPIFPNFWITFIFLLQFKTLLCYHIPMLCLWDSPDEIRARKAGMYGYFLIRVITGRNANSSLEHLGCTASKAIMEALGLPWWSSGWDSMLPMQGTLVLSLVEELDPSCHN